MNHSSAELKSYARAVLKGKWGIFIGTNAMYLLISVGTSFVTNRLPLAHLGYAALIIRFVIQLIISIFTQLLFVGLRFQALLACRGQAIGIDNLFYAFSHNPDRFIKVALVQALITFFTWLPLDVTPTSLELFLSHDTALPVYFIFFVVYLFVAIFLFVLTLALTLDFYLLIDNPQMQAMDALKTSWRLMKGNKSRFFYISLSFIGVTLLGIIAFGIGMLWVLPYTQVTTAFFYFDVIGVLDKPATPVVKEVAPVKPNIPSNADDKPTE